MAIELNRCSKKAFCQKFQTPILFKFVYIMNKEDRMNRQNAKKKIIRTPENIILTQEITPK